MTPSDEVADEPSIKRTMFRRSRLQAGVDLDDSADLLDRMEGTRADLSEDEALRLAVEAQHATRPPRDA